jgi:hypothetical protein
MVRAHRVVVPPEDGGGWKWCLFDPATGEWMHGGASERLEWVALAWATKYKTGATLKVDVREPMTARGFRDLVLSKGGAGGG